MNSFKFRSQSLTKTWPGGRRNALVPGRLDKDGAVLTHVWNDRISSFKATWVDGVRQPYLAPIPKSEGGMAEPSEGPDTCDSSSNTSSTPSPSN
jgi:hypothetical protein